MGYSVAVKGRWKPQDYLQMNAISMYLSCERRILSYPSSVDYIQRIFPPKRTRIMIYHQVNLSWRYRKGILAFHDLVGNQ